MNLAPIILFTYKRLDTLKKTVESLRENTLSKDSDLFIFSDAASKPQDIKLINKIRLYLKTITGFKSVTIFEASTNKGLAKSIIEGVTTIINQHEKVIVLEDDLVTSKNFLIYCNSALDHYRNDKRIFSIAGYTAPIKGPTQDVYFTKRASSWGWATWKDRWNDLDWNVENYKLTMSNKNFMQEFNKMGSDMTKMLNDQIVGKINSWAIRWCYNQFISQTYTVYPTVSKIKNIGTGVDASHTSDKHNRFETLLDDGYSRSINFDAEVALDKYYLDQFLRPFSIYTRIKYKILNALPF